MNSLENDLVREWSKLRFRKAGPLLNKNQVRKWKERMVGPDFHIPAVYGNGAFDFILLIAEKWTHF